MIDIEDRLKREESRYLAIREASQKLAIAIKDHALALDEERVTGERHARAKFYRAGLDSRIAELESAINALLDSHA